MKRTIVPLLLFTLVAVGCASPTGDEESTTTESLDVAARTALPPAPPDATGPARFLIDLTLSQIDLTLDQRDRLLRVEGELDAVSKPLNLDRQTIDRKLALALRLGEVDSMSTQNLIDALAKRVEDVAPAQVRALDALWEMLDGIQRQALAETVRALRPPATPDVNGERPLGPFFGGLELTPAQHQALLAAALPPPRDRDPMEALLTAFENDGFSAGTVVRSAELGDHVRKRLGRNLELTRTLLRVLDAEQRSKLAQRMEGAPT